MTSTVLARTFTALVLDFEYLASKHARETRIVFQY
jgi:hypothetical protein